MRSSRRLAIAGLVACGLLVLLSYLVPGPRVAAQVGPGPVPASAMSRGAWLQTLAPAARLQFEQRIGAWHALPLAEREDRRERYQAWRQLPEAERLRLQVTAEQFAAFPPDRQQALRSQFQMLEKTQRRGWRLGPVLGADYEQLHPLLAYVEPGQRLPMLAALRSMSIAQRADLAVLVQRTAPQDRKALRTALLRQSSAGRSAWLQDQLAR